MNKKEELTKAINAKRIEIAKLFNELVDLENERLLVCDDTQWYTEEKDGDLLIGKMNWIDKKQIGDLTIEVPKNRTVSIDGKYIGLRDKIATRYFSDNIYLSVIVTDIE